ncbi:MAG: hypothetical protein GY859_18600, partial [Desulfobacterales bacterium]|nr:hypothetical protein [Desulfobacterales bacterium]
MTVAKKIFIIFVLTAIYAGNALGCDSSSKGDAGRRHGPPPEAFTACEGKSAGDAAQFVSPRGDTVSGTCAMDGDRLFLRPDHAKRRSSGRRHGPPPEAYTACEGKSAGDAAQFVSPRGDTVSGTCVMDGDRLFLRPDRAKGRSHGRLHGPPPEAYTACEGKSAGDAAQFVSPRGDTVS